MTKKTAFIIPLTLLIFLFSANLRCSLANDITAPTTTLTQTPTSPDGLNSWYISPVNITLTADDLDSGVKSINWLLDAYLNTQTFNNTLNQILNPSFEDVGSPINKWDLVGNDGSTVFSQDSTSTPPLDAYSAKIYSVTTGWHAFSTESNYSVTSTYQNMTSSIWVKTDTLTGNNAYYSIYLLYDDGNGQVLKQLLATSSSVSGTTAWQKITLNFVVNNTQAVGVYMEAGLNGVGNAWFDGASISSSLTNPSANFAISSNGIHDLSYYSFDNADNEELPHHNTSFKIDTKAPSRFTNFTPTQYGNSHTFIISINVTDTTSGLNTQTAEFQYSVDEDEEGSWGYYTNLTGCNSTFVQGWKSMSTNPSTNGVTQTTMTTPAVDFCDSNWADPKKIRFRIKDVAGNLGQSADFTMNGVWIRVTNGDIFSNKAISFQSPSTVTYTAGAHESISNVTSGNSWFLENYSILSHENYNEWYSKYTTTTAPPNNKLPNISGKFRINSDFTIASNTIPNGLSNVQNMSAVLFVNGDLNINSNYSLHATSGIIFIVKGEISVANNVTSVDGFFITGEEFDTGSGNSQLTLNGGVQADTLVFGRSLNGNQNSSTPAEIFTYQPKYLIVGKNQLGSGYSVSLVSID